MASNPLDRNPNLVTIDLDSLVHNVSVLSARLRGDAWLMPVVKSDAYGHGLVDVSLRLEDEPRVWGFGISTISEAVSLRNAGIISPLFLLSGCFPGEEGAVAELGLTVGVISRQMLDSLQGAAAERKIPISVHLKAETGMGRFGMEREEILEIVKSRKRWPGLKFQGIYTHMPVADQQDDPFNREQIGRFGSIVDDVKQCGWHPELVHMANSAALVNFPDAHFNLVRPGIAIYGSFPGRMAAGIGLEPVLSFESRIASLRRFEAGSLIGYGRCGRIDKNSVVAVIPAGYDDGCMRSLSDRGKVLVKGVRCNIVGRICMRALMADVTDVPGVAVGDRAVIIGSSNGDMISADELASWAGTISYELLCLIGSRNRRICIG